MWRALGGRARIRRERRSGRSGGKRCRGGVESERERERENDSEKEGDGKGRDGE